MTTKEFTDSLRLLADFYDAHPDMPLPYEAADGLTVFPEGLEGMARCRRELEHCEKFSYGDSASDPMYRFRRKFGSVFLGVHEYRDKVCTRRVVGTKTIQRQVPATWRDEDVTEEEVVWDCPESLLKKAKSEDCVPAIEDIARGMMENGHAGESEI